MSKLQIFLNMLFDLKGWILMRVLHVVEASSAGVGVHVCQLVHGQLEKGLEVELIYSPKRVDQQFRESLQSMPNLIAHCVPMERGPSLRDAVAIFQSLKILGKTQRFQVIHGHSSKGGLIARVIGFLARVPVVYTPNAISTMSSSFGKFEKSIYGWGERLLAMISAKIIAVSQEEFDHIVHIGISKNRLALVHNGVTFHPRAVEPSELKESFGIPPEQIVVGFVGRLCPQKNPLNLVRAYSILAQRRSEVTLVLVGDGELMECVKREIKERQLQHRVILLGAMKGTEVLPMFDVLVISADYEGCSIVMLEGIAAGKPIVSTRVGGAAEFIKDGVNGYVVPIDDSASLAEAMDRTISDAAHLAELKRGSESLRERVSLGRMLMETISVYETAMHVKQV